MLRPDVRVAQHRKNSRHHLALAGVWDRVLRHSTLADALPSDFAVVHSRDRRRHRVAARCVLSHPDAGQAGSIAMAQFSSYARNRRPNGTVSLPNCLPATGKCFSVDVADRRGRRTSLNGRAGAGFLLTADTSNLYRLSVFIAV